MGPQDATVRISVALCTHNGSAYVEEQLASILSQTVPPDEIVISDDASTDSTLAIVRRVLGNADLKSLDVHVLENERPLGVVANFEQALLRCTGDLLFLSDQDDVWHTDKLQKMVDAFRSGPELLLIHTDALLVDAAGRPLGSTLSQALEVTDAERKGLLTGDAYRHYLRRNLATGATIGLRKSLLSRAVPFPDDWVHDEWLATIAASTDALGYIPECLIDYRQHSSNQIGVRRPTLVNKVRRVLEPRGGRNAYLARRAVALADWLSSRPGDVSADKVVGARAKARFELFRQQLPGVRLLRILPVARAWSRHEYSLYASQGNRDVLRDLLQSSRAPGRN
jgi:glycosyltransferase involved in cell wall biosynthesis